MLIRRGVKLRMVAYSVLLTLFVFALWSNFYFLSCLQPPYDDIVSRENQSNDCKDTAIPLDFCVNREKALLYGLQRKDRAYLTLGVPTVRRQGVGYLNMTLSSLIQNSKPEQQQKMLIVVFFLDKDRNWCQQQAHEVNNHYREFIQNGLMRLVNVYNTSIYPDFSKLKRTYGDSMERVQWRTKQNFDYAFMFKYCHNMSDYYLQLEDDITAKSNYFDKIRSFVLNYRAFWFCIEFSNLGFIGKLFRSSDLAQMARFLLLFHDEQPVDLLLRSLKHIKTQEKDIYSRQILFQHLGVVSSLTNKRQFIKESKWGIGWGKDTEKQWKRFYHYNPTAVINTDIASYADHQPIMAYDMADHHFWGMPPREGNYFNIIFEEPQNISRIFIDTGQKEGSADILQHGMLQVSIVTANKSPNPCLLTITIAKFSKGDLDINSSIPENIQCLSILVTKNQSDLIVIREIAIFLSGEPEMVLSGPQDDFGNFSAIINKMSGKAFFNVGAMLQKIKGPRIFAKNKNNFPVRNSHKLAQNELWKNLANMKHN